MATTIVKHETLVGKRIRRCKPDKQRPALCDGVRNSHRLQAQGKAGTDQRGDPHQHQHTVETGDGEDNPAGCDPDGSAEKAARVEHAGALSGLRLRQRREAGQAHEKAIEAVYHGEAFFSPEIAQAALNQIVTSGGKKEPFAQLTSREREVLILIAEGQSNKEIATRLGIGVRTIETHRERIMRRLDIHSVAGLTKFAIANGMISIEESAGN